MWLQSAQGYLSLLSGDLGGALAGLSDAREIASRTGSAMGGAIAALSYTQVLVEAGHFERAAKSAQETASLCEGMGARMMADWARFFLAWATFTGGRFADSIPVLRQLLDRSDHRLVVTARIILALALLECGDTAEAVREADAAVDGAKFPSNQAAALACRALIENRSGRHQSALELAERGLELARRVSYPRAGSTIRLARSEALYLLGKRDEARKAIREARDRILCMSATLDDADLRESLVTKIDVNARTMRLAWEWLGDEVAS